MMMLYVCSSAGYEKTRRRTLMGLRKGRGAAISLRNLEGTSSGSSHQERKSCRSAARICRYTSKKDLGSHADTIR